MKIIFSRYSPRQTCLGFASAMSAAVLASAFVTEAHAAGATAYTYSPVACKVTESADQGSLWIFPSGQIGNMHPSKPLDLWCPLIHEDKHDHSGIIRVHFIKAGRQTEQGVKCGVYFNHPHASEWNFSGWKEWKSGSGQTNIGHLSFDGSPFLGGGHMLRCTLSPKDGGLAGDEGVSRLGSYHSGLDK
jgi:hypothetical protein